MSDKRVKTLVDFVLESPKRILQFEDRVIDTQEQAAKLEDEIKEIRDAAQIQLDDILRDQPERGQRGGDLSNAEKREVWLERGVGEQIRSLKEAATELRLTLRDNSNGASYLRRLREGVVVTLQLLASGAIQVGDIPKPEDLENILKDPAEE